LLFCGGTGILPFLDLLDFLLKKAIYLAIKEKGFCYFFIKIDPSFAKDIDFLNNDLENNFSENITIKLFASFHNENGNYYAFFLFCRIYREDLDSETLLNL
jgi:hypothetical protein